MATEATFDNQLQALATATANFANDKDTQIKNTIITALGGSTQAGGGSGSGKTEGFITYDPTTHIITYNGDADEVVYFHLQESTANQEPGIYEMTVLNPTNPDTMEQSLSEGDILVTPETDDFTAAFFEYYPVEELPPVPTPSAPSLEDPEEPIDASGS